jgi:glycosyltransferase involved in cell wall biosynthesis
MLIAAARILEESGEQRLRFLIAGDGDQRARWMALAAGLQSVEFTGWVSDDRLLGRAHIGLILMQGGITRFWLGNKIFEYLAGSLAVVNDVPGEPAAIVESRDVGLNIEPGASAQLAAALRALADDPARVARYMDNARDSFRREFDRDVIQSRYADYLATIIARSADVACPSRP